MLEVEDEDLSMAASRRPVGLDLFSGAGGMALGFEQAGFDVAAALEYDPIHAAVHSYNFPLTSMVCADATRTKGSDLLDAVRDGLRAHGVKNWNGVVDCVWGGPPCQGASMAGHRRVDDERNELMFDFLRLAHEVRARTFVIENVPGFMSGDHKTLLNKLLRRCRDTAWRLASPIQILNASDFQVPQDRKRLFILGAYDDNTIPQYPAPTCSPVAKKPGAKRGVTEGLPDGPTVRDAISDILNADDFVELLESDEVDVGAKAMKKLESIMSPYVRRLRGLNPDPGDLSRLRVWGKTLLTSSNRTTHEAKCVTRFSETEQGAVEPISRFYRLHNDGLCCTLRAGTGRERGAFNAPRPLHPTHDRVITVREALRLHSYPDWFRMHVTKWHGFRSTGNSVPPLLARAVAAEVVKSLKLSPKKPTTAIELGDKDLLSLDMTAATARMNANPDFIPGARRRGES